MRPNVVMRVLIVDNRDSFTFNLCQVVAKATGHAPVVVGNREPDWPDLIRRRCIEAIIISPGPGSPENSADFGRCGELIRNTRVPLLGVCLGHQGVGLAYGAKVVRASVPMHGRVSRVTHDGSRLFAGIPASFDAVRYHSLCLDRHSVPSCLTITAVTGDGIPMAIEHRHRLHFGVQFHPESVLAEYGERLVGNFLRLATSDLQGHGGFPYHEAEVANEVRRPRASDGRSQVIVTKVLDTWVDPPWAFRTLFGHSETAYWLDSSACIPGYSRFSIMGDGSGPDCSVLRFRTRDNRLSITRGGATAYRRFHSFADEIRAWLSRPVQLDESLPLDFQTGLVGYVGYEMCRQFGMASAQTSRFPDAAFIDASRCLIFDHAERRIFAVARSESPTSNAVSWCRKVARLLERGPSPAAPVTARPGPLVACLADGPRRYLEKIRRCKELLSAGESYQVCLSSEFTVDGAVSPLEVYCELRALNPAPYSAFLRFGNFAILSSSPERFLRVSADRGISAKPIKGTAARRTDADADRRLAEWLRTDEKSRSENLMVVDLLRNDIGRVAVPGSVHVPYLMEVESYATVHQLVSTVTGQLPRDRDCLHCLATAFPGGSMTGAPKIRTMSIIDRLERRARGPYAGALGYISYGDRMDLSIVIRTIVWEPSRATVASGGAIVAMSDPPAEFEEMLLKARAPLRALAAASVGDPAAWTVRYATP